jgi:hypothetical protein
VFTTLADPSVLRIVWRELGRPDRFDCLSYLAGSAPLQQRYSAHPIFTQRVEPAGAALPVSEPQNLIQLADAGKLALLRPHGHAPARFLQDIVLLEGQDVPFETFHVDPAGHVTFRGAPQAPEAAHAAGVPPLQLLAQGANVRRTEIQGLPVALECSTGPARPGAAATRQLRLSLRPRPGRDHAVPGPALIEIPAGIRDACQLHVSAASQPGGLAWQVHVQTADGIYALEAQDSPEPEPPQLAFIFDRTSVDPKRWLLAQKLFSQRETVDEAIQQYSGADPWIASPADWNRELRAAAEGWVRKVLEARAAGAVELFCFADRADGLDFPRMDGLDEPRKLALGLDLLEDPQQTQGALNLAGYCPGIDMYDALADALKLAVASLRRRSSDIPRGVVILGDSPPHPASDEDEMVAAIEEHTDRHSIRIVRNADGSDGAPAWPILLKIAHDHHIPVSYAFIRTRSEDALGWLADEGTPEARAASAADFNRYDEMKRRVEKAMEASLADKGSFHVITSPGAIHAKLDAALADVREGPIGGTLFTGKAVPL